MRQILLGGKVAYASGTDLSKVADGAIGVFYNKNGVPTASTTGNPKEMLGTKVPSIMSRWMKSESLSIL